MARSAASRIVSGLRGAAAFAAAGTRLHWRSIVSFTAGVGALFALVWALGLAGIIDLGFTGRHWGDLVAPATLSLALTSVAFFLGFLGAIPLGALRAFGPSRVVRPRGVKRSAVRRALRNAGGLLGFGATTSYVEGLRGTPFYVQMWIVYYFAIDSWPKFAYVYLLAGLIALTLNTTAYQAEVFRAGFQSVPQGQIDAAKALGMRGRQVFRHVTLPQGLRLITLPLVNEWISLFKASSILSFITIQELTFKGNDLGSNLGHPIEAFLLVAAFYLAITVPLSRAITYLERKRRIPGLGHIAGTAETRRRPRRVPG